MVSKMTHFFSFVNISLQACPHVYSNILNDY